MAQMMKKTTYSAPVKDVLLAPHCSFEIGVQVSNTGVSNNAEGRKIIPAGTPIGGTTSALATRTAVLQVTNSSSNGANAQGVLRYDVDVTEGNANATLVVFGFIDESKCPVIDASAKTALTKITFLNGGRA